MAVKAPGQLPPLQVSDRDDPRVVEEAATDDYSLHVVPRTWRIVLHRDAVSGGGYAMIATVISADMDAIAQSAPGSTTRFVAVDLEAALAGRRDRADRVSRLTTAVAG